MYQFKVNAREANQEDIQSSGRTALLYGEVTSATTKHQQRRLEVNDMRMSRSICVVAEKDKFRKVHAS